jgi:hypothetical protein
VGAFCCGASAGVCDCATVSLWLGAPESLGDWAFANGWETAAIVIATIRNTARHTFIS